MYRVGSKQGPQRSVALLFRTYIHNFCIRRRSLQEQRGSQEKNDLSTVSEEPASMETETTNAAAPDASKPEQPLKTETKEDGVNGGVTEIKEEKMNGVDEKSAIIASEAKSAEPSEDGDDDNHADDGSEDGKVEDALFSKMEEEDEKEEATYLHDQPTDVKAAPKLLQKAFEKGEVEPDDSEKEEVSTKAEEKPESPSKDHHYHARVSDLYSTYVVRAKFCNNPIPNQ